MTAHTVHAYGLTVRIELTHVPPDAPVLMLFASAPDIGSTSYMKQAVTSIPLDAKRYLIASRVYELIGLISDARYRHSAAAVRAAVTRAIAFYNVRSDEDRRIEIARKHPAYLPRTADNQRALDYMRTHGEYAFSDEVGAKVYAVRLEAGEGGVWKATPEGHLWRAVRQDDPAYTPRVVENAAEPAG